MNVLADATKYAKNGGLKVIAHAHGNVTPLFIGTFENH